MACSEFGRETYIIFGTSKAVMVTFMQEIETGLRFLLVTDPDTGRKMYQTFAAREWNLCLDELHQWMDEVSSQYS